jgi:pilus assembly protein CpaE
MNAPFRMNATTRDSFAAYVCDDDTLDILRPVIGDMGWEMEKCHKGGLRNAVQSLSVAPSPSILLVDLSESSDPINDINGLAEVCEPGTVVIAMGQVNDVRLFRDLMSSGIQDYLLKPVFPAQVRDVLLNAQAMLAAPRQSVEASAGVAHLLTVVVGTRGGVGATSLSTSLAWMLGHSAKRHAALLDLDIHFGTGALAMDLEPGRGLIDAIDNPSRIDGLFIERAMVRANDKLAILSAEAPVTQPMLSDGAALFQLRAEINHAFEATVVDLPRHMLVQFPHMVAEANAVVLVTELTLAGARDAIRLIAALKQSAPSARVIVVANKMPTTPGEITRKDFENSIERPIDVVIPFDPKTAVKAAKLGKTLAEAGASTKLTSGISDVMNLALSSAEDDGEGQSSPVAAAAKSGSLLGKLGGLGSLMPKKKAKA